MPQHAQGHTLANPLAIDRNAKQSSHPVPDRLGHSERRPELGHSVMGFPVRAVRVALGARKQKVHHALHTHTSSHGLGLGPSRGPPTKALCLLPECRGGHGRRTCSDGQDGLLTLATSCCQDTTSAIKSLSFSEISGNQNLDNSDPR